VVPTATGDTFYMLLDSSVTFSYYLIRRDATGMSTTLATAEWGVPFVSGLRIQYVDLSGNVMYEKDRDLSGFQGDYLTNLCVPSGQSIWGIGSHYYYGRYNEYWHTAGWGVGNDGILAKAESGYQGGEYPFSWAGTYVAQPPGYLRPTADLSLRSGTCAALAYRFRVRRPGQDGLVQRRAQSAESFTWEFHAAPGTYEVLASADNTLWVKQSATVATSAVDLNFSLPAGDLNADNTIDLLDLGKWLTERVDLTNDGAANLIDLGVILLNFGMVGDE
jgi:hypothetical protein